MFPLERYRFYYNGNKVIAVSTYAGKTVRGVAICHPNDEFDLEKGKQIAAARCGEKIALKRLRRADDKVAEAYRKYLEAEDYYTTMLDYLYDAEIEYDEICGELDGLLEDGE